MQITGKTFDEALQIIAKEVVTLVLSKQHDYGHANILAHGLTGLCVRMADKQARFHNLVCVSKKDPSNESVRDTILDKIGYDLLTLMVLDNVFELPLEEGG